MAFMQNNKSTNLLKKMITIHPVFLAFFTSSHEDNWQNVNLSLAAGSQRLGTPIFERVKFRELL
jgi:hypothetical protein